MNIELSNDKIEQLNKLFLKKYNSFTAEEISSIIENGQGITFQEILIYFEYLSDHEELIKNLEDEVEPNLIGIVSSLFSCEEIISVFSEQGYYSEIPRFVKFRQEKNLEPDFILDYSKLIHECIDRNKMYEVTSLYSLSFSSLDDELKKEIYNFVRVRKDQVYVSEEKIEAIVDLLKTGKKFGYDITELWSLVETPVLIYLCTNELDDIINVFYETASTSDKNLIDAFKQIKTTDEITQEIFTSITAQIEDRTKKRSIAQFAVKKGYVPPVKDFEPFYFNDEPSKQILCNVNLIYYVLTKESFGYSSYHDDKIYESLKSEEAKKVFRLLQEYKPAYHWGYSQPKSILDLEEILLIENIPKYFDENGIKIDVLYKLIENNEIDFIGDNSFLLFVIDKVKDKLPEDEKKYFEFIEITMKAHSSYYSYGLSDALNNIVNTKDNFYSFLNNDEQIINILNRYSNSFEILLGLVKINGITENIKNNIGNDITWNSLDVVKELLDKNIEDFTLFKSIYSNSFFFDENGAKKDKLIGYFLENYHFKELLSLSDKYVSENQKVFLNAIHMMYEKHVYSGTDKLKFIIDTTNNQDLLNTYIVDNKPSKELIDKLFEMGCLYCIEGHEEYLNDKQKMIYSVYQSISNEELKNVFCDFIESSINSIYSGTIPEETIKKIPELLDLIKLSNSSEVAGRYINIAKLILQNTNESKKDPLVQFKKIEKIFLTKDLSHMDKIFRSFQLLYPHDKLLETIRSKESQISPTLYKYATSPEETILGKEALRLYGDSTYAVEMIMYSDLLKTTIASNDKTFIDYIDDIEKGNQIFIELMSRQKDIYTLTANEKFVLNTYVYHLENLYNKSHQGKPIKLTNDLDRNLNLLMILYKDVDLSLIPDQIIKNNYYAYLGISTMKELKDIMAQAKKDANDKGYIYAQKPMHLEAGDFIKGIGGITYFDTIIQNGSVSKEFLGGDVDSDLTPFDTDLSIILETKQTNDETRLDLAANSYGPIFFVVKNAIGKYNCTRDNTEKKFELSETGEVFRKIEIFKTLGDTHYGIRTGFASTQVDYICCEDKMLVDKIGLVLAKNGFYIPVVDKEGSLLFTPEQYEHLRGKMGGLSYYRVESFDVAQTVANEFTESLTEAIRQNIEETKSLKTMLEEKLRAGFAQSGLLMKTQIDGDMQPGSVELIDTGSTGRGTNQIGDGDFDFTIRLDRIITTNDAKAAEVAQKVCEELGVSPKSGDLRKEKVMLGDKEVELDISYASKSDRITYTTDMSLSDRLETIRRQDPEQHLLVLSNIVLAKTILKKGECYKPHHASENAQGGLGGVGTENWILQNGGSLEEAATEFLIASGIMRIETTEEGKKEIIIDETTQKGYDTFKTTYSIWDFGQNQLSEKRSREFPYDNFIWNNMNQKGYVKMAKAMQAYILELHPEFKFIPKPIPQDETQQQKEERVALETVTTNVRNLLQGLKSTTLTDSSSLDTEKGK